jgi:GMP synthase-like glutamine amidotransferase
MSLRILAIGDDERAPGFLGERAAQLGHDVVCVSRYSEDPGDLDLDGVDVVMPLGSVWSVNDRPSIPWIDVELELIRRAIADEIPVLGICFGGQELALALGGSVGRTLRPELGWISIRSDEPDAVPEGPWFAWHYDEIRPPAGAQVIATNESGVQAFRDGAHLGVQFHPEVTLQTIETWSREGASQLDEAGISPARLVSESAGRIDAARKAAFRFLDGFLESLKERGD